MRKNFLLESSDAKDQSSSDCVPLDQLMGRCFRLQRELSAAFRVQPWPAGKIKRLATDIAHAQHEIASRQLAGSPIALEHRHAA